LNVWAFLLSAHTMLYARRRLSHAAAPAERVGVSALLAALEKEKEPAVIDGLKRGRMSRRLDAGHCLFRVCSPPHERHLQLFRGGFFCSLSRARTPSQTFVRRMCARAARGVLVVVWPDGRSARGLLENCDDLSAQFVLGRRRKRRGECIISEKDLPVWNSQPA